MRNGEGARRSGAPPSVLGAAEDIAPRVVAHSVARLGVRDICHKFSPLVVS